MFCSNVERMSGSDTSFSSPIRVRVDHCIGTALVPISWQFPPIRVGVDLLSFHRSELGLTLCWNSSCSNIEAIKLSCLLLCQCWGRSLCSNKFTPLVSHSDELGVNFTPSFFPRSPVPKMHWGNGWATNMNVFVSSSISNCAVTRCFWNQACNKIKCDGV